MLWMYQTFRNETTGRDVDLRIVGGEVVSPQTGKAASLSEMADQGYTTVDSPHLGGDADLEAARKFAETGSTSRITSL